MKTEFEKFYARVLKGLEKSGVNIISNLGRISDIVTDYYGQTDMKYVIQCIKFELDRGFGKEKVPGIREATEADLVTEFDKNEDFDEFVDQVLDELDKYSDATVYDYYSEHRDEIGEFMDDDKDPSEVAELLSKYFNETGKPDEYDPEHEAYLKDIRDYEDSKMNAYNIASENENFEILQSLHGSDKCIKRPTGADGQWATEDFPISFAIAENDVATLEEYFENGIPSRLITGDEEDEEVIPWDQQYSQEFEQDYSLLTSKVAIEHKDINDALKFMIENVDNFIVSPFDLYNLFVSSTSDDGVVNDLAQNYADVSDDEVQYFGDNITINDIVTYLNDAVLP